MNLLSHQGGALFVDVSIHGQVLIKYTEVPLINEHAVASWQTALEVLLFGLSHNLHPYSAATYTVASIRGLT